MPIFCPTLAIIDLNATRRHAGLTQPTALSSELLTEACNQALLLSVPKGVWQVYAYDQDDHTIMAHTPFSLTDNKVISKLVGAVEVAIMAATIGIPLEQEVSNLFMQNRPTSGMLLDAAGTTAIEMTCKAVCNIIAQQAAQAGLTAGGLIIPGHGDCPIELQPEILELATGHKIDLSLTGTKMLVPRKSITAIIGLYPYHHALRLPQQQDIIFDNCSPQGCQARKETKK